MPKPPTRKLSRLQRLLLFNPIAKNNLRVFLRSDQAILMLCVIIAFVLWLITKLSYQYKSSLNIKLAYTLPSNKTFTHVAPQLLEADIQATGWDLLFTELPAIKIDLHNPQNQQINSNALAGAVQKSLPLGVELLQLRPEQLSLQVEDIAQKEIPILLDWQANLAPQYKLVDSPSLVPASVKVSGAASVIKNLKHWRTSPLVLSGLKSSLSQKIELLPAGQNNLKLEPTQTLLTAKVEQVTEKRLEIPVVVENLPDSLLILVFPNKISLTATVGLSDYARLNSSEFKAVADYADVQGDNSLRVRLERRANYIEVAHYEPKRISFVIKKNQPTD